MKLGIIGGAGLLGATTAFCAAAEGCVSEIVLHDVRGNMAQAHAMDMAIASFELGGPPIRAGGFSDLDGCDILFNTAGVPERKVASRAEYLEGNLAIYKEIGQRIKGFSRIPVIVSASNPIDVLNYVLYQEIGCGPEKLIGFSRNDSLRFRWSIALECGLPASDVRAYAIGEHGDAQVPLFSSARRADGSPIALDEEQRRRVLARIQTWFSDYQQLDSGRSSGWTSGVSMARVIRMIADGSDEPVCCSVIPSGEYGLSGLSIGLPVRLGPGGVREIAEAPLDAGEREALDAAADKIRKMTGNV